jgi:hypothetical protein
MSTLTRRFQLLIVTISLLVAGNQSVQAQAAPSTQPAAAGDAKPFKPEELEQLAAPIALYPDSLVAQIFMASTYPLEVVQAERWMGSNKTLKGDALAAELSKKDWDASVKSLVEFPQVLEMMSKQLDWTTKLGDAFIADRAAIMAAVQRLRAKAQQAGNLKTTTEQKVVVEPAPPQTIVVQGAPPPPPQIIKIESPSPTVVYVPTYNPTVVYGTWPYPAYPPPPPAYPPGYVATGAISFAAGVAVGAAWNNNSHGDCNWHGGDVDVDVNRNTNVNRNSNVNRQSTNTNVQNRTGSAQGASASSFQHDPSHRKGVSYRDQASAAKVGQTSANNAAAGARENYRGRTDAGGQQNARGASAGQQPGNMGASANRGASGAQQPGNMGGSANRGASASQQPAGQGGGANRGASAAPSSSSKGGAFAGADQGGAAARESSSRGQASRGSSSPSRTGPGSGGGGGSRGGGGGGGGGRR